MKIGVLTFHTASNFGANLQAYSSVCIYKRLGHEVNIINFIREKDKKYINSVNPRQFSAHNDFARNSLPVTREVKSDEELRQIVEEEQFDLISIGADAVWRTPKDENELTFFADWLQNQPKCPQVVAMSAAHMGNGFSTCSAKVKERLKADLEKFSYIAVRDQWTRDKINQDIFGHDFVKVINPDPVIWLSDFTDGIATPNAERLAIRPYYLMSLPVRCDGNSKMQSWFSEFKKLVNNAGYDLVELPIPEGISGLDFDYTIGYPINPLHWFTYIRNAKAFCGLRFHAIMSAISSGTPFFSIDNYGKQSLLLNLARYVGFYRIGRAFDSKSKIRNLLNGSGFEGNRVSGNITQISPRKVFELLECFDCDKLIAFRDNLREVYSANIDSMFNSLKYGN